MLWTPSRRPSQRWAFPNVTAGFTSTPLRRLAPEPTTAGVICRMTAGPTTYQSPLAKRPQAYELCPRSKTICALEPGAVDVYLMSVPVHMPAVGGGGGGRRRRIRMAGGGSGGGGSGGVVPTTPVAAEVASAEPRSLVAVTRARRRKPTSAAETR